MIIVIKRKIILPIYRTPCTFQKTKKGNDKQFEFLYHFPIKKN